MPELLIAEAESAVSAHLVESLTGQGWHVQKAATAEKARKAIAGNGFAAAIVGKADTVPSLLEVRPTLPVILMEPKGGIARTIGALRAGVYTYFSDTISEPVLADIILHTPESADWKSDLHVTSSSPDWIGWELRCRMATASLVLQWVREIEAESGPACREDISTAVREMLMNAIEHGGQSDPNKWVRIERIRTTRAIQYHVVDPGSGFSFHSLPHAAISNPREDPVRHIEVRSERGYRPGGFGLLMIQNLADELIYNDKGNEVLFVKYLEKPKPRRTRRQIGG